MYFRFNILLVLRTAHLKICSVNPGQVGFSVPLESFFLLTFGIQKSFSEFFKIVNLGADKHDKAEI